MKLVNTLLAAALFSAVVPAAFATSDYLLEIDGVKGESSARGTHIKKATLHVRKQGNEQAQGTTPRTPAPLELQAAQKPSSGLLLPAVQKVREAAAR
jgi:hypothetical protein